MNIQENVSMMRSYQYDKRLNLCLKIEVVYENQSITHYQEMICQLKPYNQYDTFSIKMLSGFTLKR